MLSKYRRAGVLSCFLVFFVCLFSVLSIGSSSNKACAQALESNVCDADIWDTIVGRAWIEAQREVEMNQSFITRPDSVLELSCFDGFLNAASGVGVFSNAGGANSLKVRLGTTALTAMQNYLGSAGFSTSDMGGGTYAGTKYTASIDKSLNSCSNMYSIWNYFKCSNMPDLQVVLFEDIAGEDPRMTYVGGVPSACSDKTAAGDELVDDDVVWIKQLNRLNSVGVAASKSTYFDVVTTFSDMTAPVGDCAPPIPTGVTIVRTDGSEDPEMVCPNPGCSYDGAECKR